MLRVFVQLLKNEDGFTPVECGILACLTVIFAEKLIAPF
jgi:Flp pilus assembly pilin Flp